MTAIRSDDRSRAVTDENALTANALTANALTANALTANALTANALTANALTANALTANALRDPLAREFLKYVVVVRARRRRRASSMTRRRDDVHVPGLARAWRPSGAATHGSCDGACQRWVSACVLARVDAAGVEREISIRGDNPALRPEANELRDYTEREATYFGNVFIAGPAALPLPVARRRPATSASAAIRSTTAR